MTQPTAWFLCEGIFVRVTDDRIRGIYLLDLPFLGQPFFISASPDSPVGEVIRACQKARERYEAQRTPGA